MSDELSLGGRILRVFPREGGSLRIREISRRVGAPYCEVDVAVADLQVDGLIELGSPGWWHLTAAGRAIAGIDDEESA